MMYTQPKPLCYVQSVSHYLFRRLEMVQDSASTVVALYWRGGHGILFTDMPPLFVFVSPVCMRKAAFYVHQLSAP